MLRSEIIKRMSTVWAPYSLQYSQAADHDCSAYVCAVLGIPRKNTVTLVTEGWIYEIAIDDLKPGDMVGHCGEGTAGDAGHIQMFDAWLNQDPNDNHYYVWEMTPAIGPSHSLHDWPIGFYKAYRFRDVQEDPAPTPPTPTRRYVDVIAYNPSNIDWRSTLWGIANHYGRTVVQLAQWNGITNVNLVKVGQRIYVDPA